MNLEEILIECMKKRCKENGVEYTQKDLGGIFIIHYKRIGYDFWIEVSSIQHLDDLIERMNRIS